MAHSGRKRESIVWDFFDYDGPKDESVFNILLATYGEDGGGVERKCAKVIKGKNPTNLKRHLEAAHDSQHKQMRF
jgi:hypothetical protein